jgi:HEPN domain-containing protein
MSGSDARGWIEKCRGDIDVVRRSLVPSPDPNLEAAAYHCQQAGEKAVKALLVHLGIAFPRGGGKGHDLRVLATNIPRGHALYCDAWALAHLTPWATAFRYPPDDPASSPPVPTVSSIKAELNRITALVDSVEAEINSVGKPQAEPS